MIQNGILLSSFPFGRITSCIMGVTALNQDTKLQNYSVALVVKRNLPKIKI